MNRYATIDLMFDSKRKLKLNRFARMPLPPQFEQNFRYPASKRSKAMHARMATNTERNQPRPLINTTAMMDDQRSAGATGPASEPVTLQNYFTQTAEEAQ